MEPLEEKLKTKRAKVAVIGLGYVGLPLAVGFAQKGFNVVGIDSDRRRVQQIQKGRSYILDIRSQDLKSCLKRRHLRATRSYQVIREIDVISICVPTPLRKTKEPDLSYIVSAVKGILPYLHRSQLLILESTTYPGTTEELILPLLESKGLKAGKDFYLCFSPERVDPGNPKYRTENIPKIVGGVTKQCSSLGKLFYQQLVQEVIVVSSPKVAEMVKLLENTFRSVNIGLVNELALMSHRLGINVWEVIEAAKTKPFGFMPFYPGPGLGGHCIPIDPIYLSWKARLHGFEVRFIDLATVINSYMPRHVVERLTEILNEDNKPLKGTRILLLGVAYKKNVTDVRESPALEIIDLLREKGAKISYHDPYVQTLKLNGGSNLSSVPLGTKILSESDCVVILTDHTIDYSKVVKKARLIFDTRNALATLPPSLKKGVRIYRI